MDGWRHLSQFTLKITIRQILILTILNLYFLCTMKKDLSLGDNITEKLKFDNIENLKALEEPTIKVL